MNLYTIDTGFFKLDGGAMFGVVPKVLWSKTNPSDEKNLCPWAMRSLLIEDGDRLILIDNGIGDKQDDKFLKHYYLHGDCNLEKSLNKKGFGKDEITDAFSRLLSSFANFQCCSLLQYLAFLNAISKPDLSLFQSTLPPQ